MRSQFLEATSGAGLRSKQHAPNRVAGTFDAACRAVRPEFAPGPHAEAFDLAFARVVAALATSTGLLDCHSVQVEPVAVSSPRTRREFWALCGLSVVALGGFVLALLVGSEVLSALVLLGLALAAVAGAMWGLAGVAAPTSVVPEACVEVDVEKARRLVEESLGGIDDAVKILNSRCGQKQGRVDDDLPDDVVDLMYWVLGDSLSGRQVDRSEDVADALRLRGIEVVRAFTDEADYRFSFRLAPGTPAPVVARPALVRADGTLVRPGAVLVPEGK